MVDGTGGVCPSYRCPRKELGSRRSKVKLWVHSLVGLLDVSSGLVGFVGFHQAFSVVKVLVPGILKLQHSSSCNHIHIRKNLYAYLYKFYITMCV